MLILHFSHKGYISPRPFWDFEKWTKKMSKIENPKYFWEKNKVNIINSPNNLKKFIRFKTLLLHLFHFLQFQ